MTQTTPRHGRAARTLLLAGTIAILAACGAPAPREDNPVEQPPIVEPTPEQMPTEISLELPPSAFDSEFFRIEQALAQSDWMQARSLLDALPADQLSQSDRVYSGYLGARIDYLRGDQAQALEQLDALHDPLLPPALTYRLLSLKQHVLSLQRKHLPAAQVAIELLALSPSALAPDWKRRAWRELQRERADALRAARVEAQDSEWLGWLDLALITRENTLAIAQPLQAWLHNHPDHLAANPLPGGLQYTLATTVNPGRVALLLPLSGRLAPAGQAVLEGYLAAHYAARISGGAALDVTVIDTQQFESANAAYAEAVRRGANLVVGPLNKTAVADLTLEPQRPIPIIALNRIEADVPAAGAAMVQMALSAEDEARSLATLAFGTGARHALVVHPDGDWGTEVTTAFREQWEMLGGSIAAAATFANREDHSNSVKAALGLADSESRAQRIESILSGNVELTPRRRQDTDAVILLTRNAAQARSIKPLLAFHYAGELPVYGLSGVYGGLPDKRDKDLSGITFVETPWLLGGNPGLRVAIAAGDTGSDSYTRLNALGADAFLLQAQFPRLSSGPDALLSGNTGLLSIDPQLRVLRDLPAATFDKGTVKPL